MNGKQPQPKDVLEHHFDKALNMLDKNNSRNYNFRGEIADAFVQMRKILRGKNTTLQLRDVREDIKNVPQQIDTAGWGIENDDFMRYAAKVDRSMALKFEIFPSLILTLDRVGQTDAVSKQVANNVQTERFVQEEPGLLDSFRGWVRGLRPQWKQERDKSIAMLSTLFEDPHITTQRWEAFKNQHWKNMMKAVEFEPGQFWPVMVLELHALADVEMRVLRMVETGIQMRVNEQEKRVERIAAQIVQSKAQQLQHDQLVNDMMRSVSR